MDDFLTQVLEVVTIGSMFGSVLLGLLFGAFYGYYLDPTKPPIYPRVLWLVGIGFIAMFTVWSMLSHAPFQPAYQLGRAILWTLTCAALPIGRFGRYWIQKER